MLRVVWNGTRDLRSALICIHKSIGDIPFPNSIWPGFDLAMTDAKESVSGRESQWNQLESFLRRVFAEVYLGSLHPYLAEVAIHLHFVGCDGVLSDDNNSTLSLNHQVTISETTYGKRTPDSTSKPDSTARMHLKRSIQRYAYRIFLLLAMEKLIAQFVDGTKETMKVDTSSMTN